MSLPKVPYMMAKNKSQIVSIKSINYTDMLQDGDVVDSKNISARAFPCITTRKARKLIGNYQNVEAMTVFGNKIAHISGGKFYYDGQEIGDISNGYKRMEKINTKLVIFPDKVYFDLQDKQLHPMAVVADSNVVTFAKDSITFNNTKEIKASGGGCYASGNSFEVRSTITLGSNEIAEEEVFDTIEFTSLQQKYAFTLSKSVLAYASIKDRRGEFQIKGTSSLPKVGDVLTLRPASYFVGEYITSVDEVTIDNDGKGATVSFYSSKIDDTSFEMISWENKDIKLGKGAIISTAKYTEVSFDVSKEQPSYIWNPWVERTVGGMSEHEYEVTDIVKDDYGRTYYAHSPSEANHGAFIGKVTVNGWAEDPDIDGIFSAGNTVLIECGDYKQSAKISEVWSNGFDTVEPIGDIDIYGAPCQIYLLGEFSYDFAAEFKVGDAVFVSGSSKSENNINFVISKIDRNKIYSETEIFTEVEDTTWISVERRIPNLDFICESGNRIWGCVKAENTIYASALGDPTNFFDGSGESTDSYVVPVGSEGHFTACCRHGDSVLFWKENKLHKVLGAYPAEYTIYDYDIEGVEDGSESSLAVMNETLYFKSPKGVCIFSGGVPQTISANFGDKRFHLARAGVDGDSYYISMTDDDGKSYLFVYENNFNLWVLEDDLLVRDFLRSKDGLYMLTDNGEVYLCEAGDTEADMEWHLQLAPIYETIEGKKSYSRLVFRLELEQKSYVIVEVKTDGGAWREAGKVVGKREGIFPVSLPINRCDKFEIRLRGKGKCKIHTIKREFYVGGDK